MKFFKRQILKGLMLLSLTACSKLTSAQLLFVDDFNNPVGQYLTTAGWNVQSGASNPIQTTNPGLVYPGYTSSGLGNAATLHAASGQCVLNGWPTMPQTTGSVYAAMMVHVKDAPTSMASFSTFFDFYYGAVGCNRISVYKDMTGNIAFGFGKQGTQQTTGFIYDTNTTYLMVIKYTFNPGGGTDDESSLFVFDGTAISSTEPFPTIGSLTDTNVADIPAISNIRLVQNSGSVNIEIDGIRAGTSWADIFAPTPAAPSILSQGSQSQHSISMKWNDNSNNEMGFIMERRNCSACAYLPIDTLAVNDTLFTDNLLPDNTQFFYRLRSFSGSLLSPYSNVLTVSTLPYPPSAPSNLSAYPTASTTVNLTWMDNSVNEDNFVIERSLSPGGPFTSIGASLPPDLTFSSDYGASVNTTYYYRIKAVNIGGSSSYSTIDSATTMINPGGIPSAPSGLVATMISSNQIDLNWIDNSSNETAFWIELSTVADFSSSIVVTGNTQPGLTHFSKTGLLAGTTYYFRIKACNFSSCSGYSNIDSTTTSAYNSLNLNSSSSGSSFITTVGVSSGEKTFIVSGTNLTSDVIISLPMGFEVSLTTGSGFTDSLSITPVTGILAPKVLYVRYNPTVPGNQSGYLTASCLLAPSKSVALSGTGIINGGLSTEKEITSFSFAGLSVNGTIQDSSIDVLVPEGIPIASLIATFSISPLSKARVGGVEQISGVTVNDFTNPVQYEVIAEDLSTKIFTVNVSISGGIDEKINDDILHIYPNPASDFITINADFKKDENASIFIYDCFGRKLKEQAIIANKGTTIGIMTNDLPTDVYLVRLTREDNKSVFKKISIVQ